LKRSLLLTLLLFLPFCVIAKVQVNLVPEMVFCTFRDSRGLIWLGTEKGLKLYQGNHLVSFQFPQDSVHHIAPGLIYAIQEDEAGFIWAASYTKGITVFNPISNRYRQIPDTGCLRNRSIISMQRISGGMQINTDGGAIQCNRKTLQCVILPIHIQNPNVLLSKNFQGVDYWLINSQGVLRRKKGLKDSLLSIPGSQEVLMGLNQIGTSIFVSGTNGLYLLQAHGFKKIPVRYLGRDISGFGINDLLQTEDGNMYLNSLKYGMLLCHQMEDYIECESDVLNHWFKEGNSIYSNFYDSLSRTFYIGTQQGLFVVSRPGQFVQAVENPSLLGTVRALYADQGGLYIGTEDGVFHLGAELKRLKENDLPGKPLVTKIHAWGASTVASGNGIYTLNEQGIQLLNSQIGQRLKGESICVSVPIDDSQLLLFSRIYKGIFVLNRQFPAIQDSMKLDLEFVTYAEKDGDDIWLMGFSQANRINYKIKEIKRIHIPKAVEISQLSIQKDSKWISSEVYGAIQLRENEATSHFSFANITGVPGLKALYQHGSFLWYTTADGIGFYHLKNRFNRYFRAGESFPEGLFMQSAICVKGDTLFAGGVNQLIKVNMQAVEESIYSDSCLLINWTLLKGAKRQLIERPDMLFKYDENNLEVQLVQSNLQNKSGNCYTYQLNDGEELQVENSGNIKLYNLQSGKHILRIKQLNEHKVVQAVQFHILPPWYQTTWFRIALLLLMVANAIWITRLYFKRQLLAKQKELEKQQALQSQRDRISIDMHDDLGSGLSSIKMISEMLKRKHQDEETKTDLNQIVDEASELTATMRDLVWSLNPRNDTILGFADHARRFVKQYFERADIEVHFQLNIEENDLAMHGLARRNLLMILKETCTNIYKYAHTRKVDFCLMFQGTKLIIQIQDHGKGLPENASENNGIYSMRKRVQEIGGTIHWYSDINGLNTVVEWTLA